MSTPTIRDMCAALSGDVNYLIACIRDGSSDSCALQECLDRASTARDLLAAEPVGEGPSERDVAEWINGLPLWHGATRDELTGIVLKAFTHWGRPAARPAPAPPAEALAARPLVGQMARLGRLGLPTVGEIITISSRAAAWLRENPPGQPVAIEPRGCPIPGACSCVEPAPPAPLEVGDRERLRIMAAGIRYGYTAGHEDTVEACYGEPDAVAADYAPEILGELGIAPAAPVVEEIGELVKWLEEESEAYRQICGSNLASTNLARAATQLHRQQHLLTLAGTELDRLMAQQQAAPAPAVVPVGEGPGPGKGDLDAEGTCWVWNFTAHTWGLFRLDLTAHSHWLPAHAIPLPQGGEVEG